MGSLKPTNFTGSLKPMNILFDLWVPSSPRCHGFPQAHEQVVHLFSHDLWVPSSPQSHGFPQAPDPLLFLMFEVEQWPHECSFRIVCQSTWRRILVLWIPAVHGDLLRFSLCRSPPRSLSADLHRYPGGLSHSVSCGSCRWLSGHMK